jgi:hypothetical protein
MTLRYEFARAAGGKDLLLIFAEGAFESLPFEIRLSAPWTGHGYGEVGDLKSADRWQLRHVGYVVLRETDMAEQSVGARYRAGPAAGNRLFQEAA